MKPALLYSVLFVTLFIVSASCTKTANTATSNTGPYIFMKSSLHKTLANSDTALYQPWISDLTVATAFYPSVTFMGSKTRDSKNGKAGQFISFTIKDYPGFHKNPDSSYINPAGTTFTIDGVNVSGYWSPDGVNKVVATSGTITLTNGTPQSATGSFSLFFADGTYTEGDATTNTFGVLW